MACLCQIAIIHCGSDKMYLILLIHCGSDKMYLILHRIVVWDLCYVYFVGITINLKL